MMDDPDTLCLVNECRELEDGFGTHITMLLFLMPTLWICGR